MRQCDRGGSATARGDFFCRGRASNLATDSIGEMCTKEDRWQDTSARLAPPRQLLREGAVRRAACTHGGVSANPSPSPPCAVRAPAEARSPTPLLRTSPMGPQRKQPGSDRNGSARRCFAADCNNNRATATPGRGPTCQSTPQSSTGRCRTTSLRSKSACS